MVNEFDKFSQLVTEQFNKMALGELYVVDAGDLFSTYLGAFPEGTNPIFRERTEHDCQCCRNFIINLGNLISIVDGEPQSVWDVEGAPYPYNEVAKVMAAAVTEGTVKSIFRTTMRSFGSGSNTDSKDNRIVWNHFFCKVPSKFITSSPGSTISESVSRQAVFKRGLEEFNQEDFTEILDLIGQNAIYRGAEFKGSIQEFKALQRKYLSLKSRNLVSAELYTWEQAGHWAANFRNTAIGTLFVDLANEVGLEESVRKFEQKLNPVNYKRPTALISKKMIEDAVKTLQDLGLEDAVERRLAQISDISVNDVLYVNNDIAPQMRDSIAALLSDSASAKPRKFSENPTPISIEEFMAKGHKDVQLIVDRGQEGNFVTVTAPVHENVGQLFKWDNNFAWSYDGNVTDSIKQRVGKAGGNITNALLRCSLAWFNTDDLDIHCVTPVGEHIYFGNRSGVLDVDMNVRNPVRNAVENLSWRYLQDGTYKITVNNYSQRETSDVGCTLEVEHGGQIQQFHYNQRVTHNVHMLNLEVKGGKLTKVTPVAKGLVSGSFGEKWGVKYGEPTKVHTIMLSPNHWENAGGFGNKHWFFILEGCRNTEPARGIYNEFLCGKLEKHRKVFEVLGEKTKCAPTEQQLSGVGFSSTRKDQVKVIADGRPYVISF